METRDKVLYWVLVPLVSALVPVLFGWKPVASLNGWIPKDECPGKPIKLSITSPVSGLTLRYSLGSGDAKEIQSSFVVESTHPIADDWHIGILSKGNNEAQYELNFPSPDIRITNTEFVWHSLRAVAHGGSDEVIVRAVLVDDYRRVGEYFSDIQQVIGSDGVYSVSEPISVKLAK